MSNQEFVPEEMLNRYRNLADLYAPAKAKREYLEEYKKSLLALLMKASTNTSIAAQERDARADPQYAKLIEDIYGAILEEEKLRYHMKAVEIEFEMWRTACANERFERKAYNA